MRQIAPSSPSFTSKSITMSTSVNHFWSTDNFYRKLISPCLRLLIFTWLQNFTSFINEINHMFRRSQTKNCFHHICWSLPKMKRNKNSLDFEKLTRKKSFCNRNFCSKVSLFTVQLAYWHDVSMKPESQETDTAYRPKN